MGVDGGGGEGGGQGDCGVLRRTQKVNVSGACQCTQVVWVKMSTGGTEFSIRRYGSDIFAHLS